MHSFLQYSKLSLTEIIEYAVMFRMQIFDCLIIGAGPAGLSAAIYMGRYNRLVLVINKGIGRIDSHEINENYLGFPQGIPSKKIYILGQQQAEKFGAIFALDEIKDIKKENATFIAKGERGEYCGKTIILATGVTDIYPEFRNIKKYIGKSLFWCLTCDGYKTIGKKIAIIGKNDHAAITALQFLNYTKNIVFISNCSNSEMALSNKRQQALKKAGIPLFVGTITNVSGKNGMVEKIILDTREKIAVDYIINQQGATPNNILARKMGIICNKEGFIKTDMEQRTNIPFTYAAGDITEQFAHQIVAAAYEGSAAAIAANYDLYRPEQKDNE